MSLKKKTFSIYIRGHGKDFGYFLSVREVTAAFKVSREWILGEYI